MLPNSKLQSESFPRESGKLQAHCANCHEEIQSALLHDVMFPSERESVSLKNGSTACCKMDAFFFQLIRSKSENKWLVKNYDPVIFYNLVLRWDWVFARRISQFQVADVIALQEVGPHLPEVRANSKREFKNTCWFLAHLEFASLADFVYL